MTNKILIVDDDPMIHKLIGFSLKEEDHDFDSRLNAEEAQVYLETHHTQVNAIILDWEMPGMNGLELLKWMKSQKRYQEIPVVMLTANSERQDIQKGIEAGAYYYVTKPFNKDFLQSILSAAISDYTYKKNLVVELREAQNPFRNLITGSFKIKTLKEAQRLSVNIANATASPEETLMICELLNNAIEHGNLGISYQEKSELIDREKLNEEIENRLQSPEYKDKYARVDFKHNNDKIKIFIEDQGVGFEYKKYLQFDESRVFDSHGRGIAMANSMLNIRYIGKGNKVEVNIPLFSKS